MNTETKPVYTPAQLHAMGRFQPEDAPDESARMDALREEAGREHFAEGERMDDPISPFLRGWIDGHREAYAAGVVAFLRWHALPSPKPDADNPHPQFSGAWEAWADGFEAEANREPLAAPLALEPVRIVITMDGGLIHSVHDLGAPVEALVIDYDTEGGDDDDVVEVPQDADGTHMADAFVRLEGGDALDPHIRAFAVAQFAILKGES